MKRLFALFLVALPAYASATVWQLNAVGDARFPLTGEFVENKGAIGAWHVEGWPNCAFFGDERCTTSAKLTSQRLISFRQNYNPAQSVLINLSLVTDLDSAKVIDLVPGHIDLNDFGEPIYSGSTFYQGGEFAFTA